MHQRLCMATLAAMLLLLPAATGTLAGDNGTQRPLQATATGYGHWPGPGAPGSLDCSTYLAGETTFAYLGGTMTHLGRVHVAMRHCTFYPPDEWFTDTGVIDIVAADGDVLHGTYETWLTGGGDIGEPITAGFAVTFDGTGSSGRFAGATGTADGTIAFVNLGYGVNVWPAPHWQLGGTVSY